MTMAPDEPTKAGDGGGEGLRLTAPEWAILEKYHRKGYDKSWNREEKILLTGALKLAYGQPGALSTADLARIRKWIEEGLEDRK